jgi:hypothetical protein
MTEDEQNKQGETRRMSMILWDMFTGSAPYRDIFMRTLHPLYLIKLGWTLAISVIPIDRKRPPNWVPVRDSAPAIESE